MKGDIALKNKLSIVLIIGILLFSTGMTAASYQDIAGSWASESIQRLKELDVFSGIYDGSFKPDAYVTYDELIEISGRSFDLTNIEKQNLYNWLDHLIVMNDDSNNDEFITRIELVAVASNLLGLTEHSLDVSSWQPTFVDIDQHHPLFAAIELINNLEVLPTYVADHFEPNRLSTRAETVSLLDAIMRLEAIGGQVVEILHPAERVVVSTTDGQYSSLPVETETLILRDGQIKQLNDIAVGDQVNALYDLSGNIAYVNVEQATGNQNQILQTVSGLIDRLQINQGIESFASNGEVREELQEGLQVLQQILTPEQLVAIISGDWSTVGEGFADNLFVQLTELGLTPWEAEALLSQNWERLGDMGMDRVAIVLSDYLGLTPEIFYSAINQNWDQLLEYAQVEIAQRLLTGLAF